MRKPTRIMAIAMLFCMIFSSVAMAAIPNNSVVVGNQAYDLTYLDTSAAAQTAVATGIVNAYVIIGGNVLKATDGTGVPPTVIATWPAVTYTSAAGTKIFDPGNGPEQSALSVSSVTAINPTTIKVTFSAAVDAVALSNFTVSKGTLQSAALDATKKIATLTLGGLTYGDTLSVKVSGVKAGTVTAADFTNAAVKIPTMSELYTLTVTSGAASNTIKSDGASMTMLTATLTENATGLKVAQDAQINFTTTLGSLSQPQVALTGGVATTQLRSIASATSVTAVVNATVASAPGATQYVGLSGNLVVAFTPDGSGSSTVTMVTPVSAGADQGDRFYVQFSGDVSAAAYKAAVTAAGWAGVPYGVQYMKTGVGLQNIKILDVYNLTPNTLMFVLDTDFAGSIAPTIGTGAGRVQRMDGAFTQAAADEGNFLRDNINHVISFPGIVTGVATNSSNITFMSSDVTKPFIYGVDATDNMNLVVRASEALAENIVETAQDEHLGVDGAVGGGDDDVRAAASINTHFTIDGKVVRLDSAPTAANVLAAQAANEIIVTELKVGSWTTLAKEEQTIGGAGRNRVLIKLAKDFKLASGSHGIQIAGAGDWAGNTDAPANLVTTQTFAFDVAADINAPTATVTQQSPEQFLITFTKPVETVTGKTIADAIKIYTKEGYAANPKVSLVMNANSGANDYIITAVDANGCAAPAGVYAPAAEIAGQDKFLVEFNRDWSVKLQGLTTTKDNYWKSDVSPLQFVFNDVTSATGVPIVANSTQAVANPYDGTSPEISANTQDLYLKSPKVAFRTQTATAGGQFVYVEMTEPVQMVGGAPVAAITNPVTPSLIQDPTPAGYNGFTGLPVPTFRFINKANTDLVVQGNVVGATLAADDRSFVVKPATDLSAGVWTLYIEQISDDHGNTAATISREVTVPATQAAVTDTKVAWAAFDDNFATAAGNYDYLYVKFTKVMKPYVANGVDATTNYKFRGYDLPAGSQVFRGIAGITDNWDGVTIRMPVTSWDGIADGKADYTTNVTVASNFQSDETTPETLSAPYQFEITNVAGGHAADKDGITATGLFEALYVNATATGIAKGTTAGTAAILKATAGDAGAGALAGNGKIDTMTLVLSNTITTTAADKIYVNGKEFVNSTVGAGTTQVYSAIAANEITGTASTALKVASSAGAIMINTGKVVDAAKPVIIAATRTGANAMTLTFSEGVYTDNPGTAALVAGDIQHSALGTCADLEVLAGITHTAGAATATATTTTATVANTSTVGAQGGAQIYDLAGNAMGVIADGTATETLVK